MRVKVTCMGKGSTVKGVSNGNVVVHYVDFAVSREEDPATQKLYGSIHLEAQTPFDYKEMGEYTLDLSDAIDIVSLSDAKKAGLVH